MLVVVGNGIGSNKHLGLVTGSRPIRARHFVTWQSLDQSAESILPRDLWSRDIFFFLAIGGLGPSEREWNSLADGWCAGNLNWPVNIQRAGKIFVSWRQVNKSGKVLKSNLFSHWKWHQICTKRDLQFQTPYHIVKSEKYEKFCASKLLILRQKWTAGVRHGTSLVVRRVSSGRPIVVLFWTKYALPLQIKPGILKLTTIKAGFH